MSLEEAWAFSARNAGAGKELLQAQLPSVPHCLINVSESLWLSSLCFCLNCMMASPKGRESKVMSVAFRVQGSWKFLFALSVWTMNFRFILPENFLHAQFDCPSVDSSFTGAGFLGSSLRRAHTCFSALLYHLDVLSKFWTRSPTFSLCTRSTPYIGVLTATNRNNNIWLWSTTFLHSV